MDTFSTIVYHYSPVIPLFIRMKNKVNYRRSFLDTFSLFRLENKKII